MKKAFVGLSILALAGCTSVPPTEGQEAKAVDAPQKETPTLVTEAPREAVITRADTRDISVPGYDAAIDDISANDMIQEWLMEQGWLEGFNKTDGFQAFILVTGYGAIAADPSSKTYNTARIAAFDKAMLDAKAKMASLLETTLSSAVQRSVSSRISDPVGNELVAGLENLPADSTAGKALQVAKETYAAELKKTKDPQKAIQSESFKRTMTNAAKTMVSGIQAFYTVENQTANKKGEIGVAAVWSPSLAEMSAAMMTGTKLKNVNGTTSIAAQLPRETNELLATFGVQMLVDKDGELILVSYGQAGAATETALSEKIAYEEAFLMAQAQIRAFAGEIVTMNAASSMAEVTRVYDEGILPDFANVSTYAANQKSYAEAMTCHGIAQIRSWSRRHPVSGKKICGSICSWSPSQAELAGVIKQKIESAHKVPTVNTPAKAPLPPKANSHQGRGRAVERVVL